MASLVHATQNPAWKNGKGYGYRMLVKMGWKPGDGIQFSLFLL